MDTERLYVILNDFNEVHLKELGCIKSDDGYWDVPDSSNRIEYSDHHLRLYKEGFYAASHDASTLDPAQLYSFFRYSEVLEFDGTRKTELQRMGLDL